MPLNRNTKSATVAAAEIARIKRNKVFTQVLLKVITEYCKCNQCGWDQVNSKHKIQSICLSRREIAMTCNTLSIETVSGKTGNWTHTMVNNLVKSFGGNFANSKRR